MNAIDVHRGLAARAREKAVGGLGSIAALVRQRNQENITTEAAMLKLGVIESFLSKDYVLYMLVNKASGECEFWAYAEKSKAGHNLIFAYGRGSAREDMRITDCAVVNKISNDECRYDYGGELEDSGQEIRVIRFLEDMAFASRISPIVSNEGAGRHRTLFSGASDALMTYENRAQLGMPEDAAVPVPPAAPAPRVAPPAAVAAPPMDSARPAPVAPPPVARFVAQPVEREVPPSPSVPAAPPAGVVMADTDEEEAGDTDG